MYIKNSYFGTPTAWMLNSPIESRIQEGNAVDRHNEDEQEIKDPTPSDGRQEM